MQVLRSVFLFFLARKRQIRVYLSGWIAILHHDMETISRSDNLKYSIVIPTLNERENITRLMQAVDALGLPDSEIVVVDENSVDGTADAVREYAAGRNDIRVIVNDGIPGLSPSIVKGFTAARGELLCCMDGDMQHDPADLRRLFDGAAHYDMVIGSRYCAGGGFSEKWSLHRTLISRTAAWLGRWVLRVKLNDPMSGFFVVRRDVFLREMRWLDPRGFKIMLELFFVLNNRPEDYRTTEIGIIFGRRHFGKSKLTARVIMNYLVQLLKLSRRRGTIRSGGETSGR